MDIDELITNLSKRVGSKYAAIIMSNRPVIISALKPNPRTLKQFINNFIIANEIFSTRSNFDSEVLLSIHALRSRWPDIYSLMSTDVDFRNKLVELSQMGPISREELTRLIEDKKANTDDLTKKVLPLLTPELSEFLLVSEKILSRIDDWNAYRRAVESVKQQKIASPQDENEVQAKLLVVELDRIEEEIRLMRNYITDREKEFEVAGNDRANALARELSVAKNELADLYEQRESLLKRTHDLRNKIVHHYRY